MKRLLTVAACAALALALTGCSIEMKGGNSSEPTPQAPPASSQSADAASDQEEDNSTASERQDLIVAESGFYSWGDDETPDMNQQYAAIIENPNPDWAAEFVEVNVSVKDEDGNVIGSDSVYLEVIFPSGKLAVCGSTSIPGAASMEFSPVVRSDSWTFMPDMTQGDLDKVLYIESVNETEVDSYETTVAGTVVNDTEMELLSSSVNIVFRDSNGSIVGGDQTYVSTVSPNSSVAFSEDIYHVPSHSTVEAYIDPGYITGM